MYVCIYVYMLIACASITLNDKSSGTFDKVFESCLDAVTPDKDVSDVSDESSYDEELQYCKTGITLIAMFIYS